MPRAVKVVTTDVPVAAAVLREGTVLRTKRLTFPPAFCVQREHTSPKFTCKDAWSVLQENGAIGGQLCVAHVLLVRSAMQVEQRLVRCVMLGNTIR